jgi:hypothetical protein
VEFKLEELIRFYDETKSAPKMPGLGSHVSAITALIGEDLIIALLRHYWKSQKVDSRICSYQCNQGTKRGKRLDAWIEAGGDLYQVEVKNWSGHSLSGYDLPWGADLKALQSFAQPRWKHYFGKGKLPPEIEKVLTLMKAPQEYSGLSQKKLICFWAYVTDSNGNPYSVATLSNTNEKIDVFSASAYLRSLKGYSIKLEMPRAEVRISLLKGLLV